MKKVFVQYGAGNIGRGFIGSLFAKSGYEVRFIDVDMATVNALNELRKYTVEIVSNEGTEYETVENVSGVDGRDQEAAAAAITQADVMATAVGANILPRIAPVIALGLRRRFEAGKRGFFNIIICENLMDADKLLAGWICESLNEEEQSFFRENVGIAEASIGRMVPVMTAEDKMKDPLRVRVERYCELPVDADAIKGGLEGVENLRLVSPFAYYIRRKLYLHNMSHAIAAYAGYLSGYEYIWQAIGDESVRRLAEGAMGESAAALSKTYGVPMDEIASHAADLINRYENRALADTVARVGGDTMRKLAAGDRLSGAAAFAVDNGIKPSFICAGLAAALFFEGPETDAGTKKLRERLHAEGLDSLLTNHSGLGGYDGIISKVKEFHETLSAGAGAAGLLLAAES